YVKGLNEAAAQAIVAARTQSPFADIRDLVRRVPELQKVHMNKLAAIGALNFIPGANHRRDALWQSELAIRPVSEMLESAIPAEEVSPLTPMNEMERIHTDFKNTGLSIGRHP